MEEKTKIFTKGVNWDAKNMETNEIDKYRICFKAGIVRNSSSLCLQPCLDRKTIHFTILNTSSERILINSRNWVSFLRWKNINALKNLTEKKANYLEEWKIRYLCDIERINDDGGNKSGTGGRESPLFEAQIDVVYSFRLLGCRIFVGSFQHVINVSFKINSGGGGSAYPWRKPLSRANHLSLSFLRQIKFSSKEMRSEKWEVQVEQIIGRF